MTPRGVDLFGRSGGSTVGYQRAGFHMTAVDIVDRSDVNPADEFVVADAFEFLFHRAGEFDFIHAGPPCQARNPLVLGTNGGKGGHVDLLGRMQEVLRNLSIPYVIEQPPGDHSLRRDLMLCGEMFPETQPLWNDHGDLVKPGVIRHRYFEIGGWPTPKINWMHYCRNTRHRGRVRGVRHSEYFEGPYVAVYGNGGYKASIEEAQQAMGTPWIGDRVDLNEAVPPAYTEFLGERLREHLGVRGSL